MLHNAFISFICGWLIWFSIDKPAGGIDQFLQIDDSMLINFQRAFDLAKAGYIVPSFIYIWYAHFIVLSLISAVILGYLYDAIAVYWSRRRRRSEFSSLRPGKKKTQKKNDKPGLN